MKLKSLVCLLSLSVVTMANSLFADASPVVSYKLGRLTEVNSWIEGNARSINKQMLSCYNPMSLVLEILPVGAEFTAQIIDTKGNVIQEGTTIVTIDKKRFKNELKIAQETLSAKEATVKQTESELARSEKLITKNAVSRQDYEKAVANYKTALADYISAKSSVDSAKIALSHCDMKAPFNGIVTKHLWSAGATRGDGDEIVEVMNIDFLLIELEDKNSTISNFLDDSMEYKIYSKHYNECTYGFNPKIKLNDIMYLIVENSKVPKVFPLETQKQLPIIRNIFLIAEYGGKLWAPIESVHKDDKGTYVYTCEPNKNNKIKNSHEWILNKVYLDVNKEFKYSSVLADMVLINKTPDSIKAGIMVLCDKKIAAYQNGTVAFLQPMAYKFYPDENVTINVPDTVNTDGCFYIPESALNTKENCVFKIVDGKAKKVKVSIIRSVGLYYEVKSDNLANDDIIAIPKGDTIKDNAQLLIIGEWNKFKNPKLNQR